MRRLRACLAWVGLILLATACSGMTAPSPDIPTAIVETESSPTPPQAPRNVYIPTEFDLLYYPTDLNLVGITGRLQFINAYADWCGECRYNRPTVHALQEGFGDRIDFLHVDIENPGAMEAVGALGITGQTQYLLLDSDGNVALRWFGVLDEVDVAEALEQILSES